MTAPLTDEKRPLSVLPLGGCGEFGRNCNLLFDGDVSDGAAIAIDCGGRIADEQHPGVEMLLPDLDYIEALGDRLLAYFLTHGHEDHIAALPHALRRRPAPIYASRYTLAHLERRLGEAKLEHIAKHVMHPGDRVNIGPFVVEAVAISHSIPEALAFVIERDQERIVVSGDFRIDKDPVDGPPTDMERLKEIGNSGVQLLIADSTGATTSGDNPGERASFAGLFAAITQSPGRAFVATFSSHVYRVEQLLRIAKSCQRKVVFLGRSAQWHRDLGLRLGILQPGEGQIVDVAQAMDLPPKQLLAIVTGCQGEPRAALAKIARGDPALPPVEANDRVILSARVIPGNEKAVTQTADQLLRRGATIVWGDQGVHVSGHGHQGDLTALLQALRPQILMPVHGDRLHQRGLAQLGQNQGLHPQDIALVDDGQAITLGHEAGRWRYRSQAPIALQSFYLDQGQVQVHDSTVLAARGNMGQRGLINVSLAIQSGPPAQLLQLGISSAGLSPTLMQSLQGDLYKELDQDLRRLAKDLGALPDDSTSLHETSLAAVRRVFRRRHQRPPQILVSPVVL